MSSRSTGSAARLRNREFAAHFRKSFGAHRRPSRSRDAFSLFLTHTLSLFEHPILSLSLALILASLLDLHPIMIVLSHLALPVLSASSLPATRTNARTNARTCTHSHVAEKTPQTSLNALILSLPSGGGCPCFKSHRFQSFASQSLFRHALTL